MEYTKKWLPLDQQVKQLTARGLQVDDPGRAVRLLESVGYYRMTGYLYPFLESEELVDDTGHRKTRVLKTYRPGTELRHVEEIIDFDRRLRMLVMEGVERVEVAVRMRVGYLLGRASPFAHEDATFFDNSFTTASTDSRSPHASKQVVWLERVKERRGSSDETFVAHFRNKYDDHMPIWALTELLELGQLSVLYRGMLQKDAEDVAAAFGVPQKKMMTSWLASLNYVRNVAAHHGRLFNRNLQNAPSRPKKGQVPLLDHLREPSAVNSKEGFGTYNALAIISYMLRSIEVERAWAPRLVELLRSFPTSHALSVQNIGAPLDWHTLDLWQE